MLLIQRVYVAADRLSSNSLSLNAISRNALYFDINVISDYHLCVLDWIAWILKFDTSRPLEKYLFTNSVLASCQVWGKT